MKKEKIKNELYYLWTLYRIPLIGGLIFLLIVGGFIIAALQKKDNTLEVMLIDSHAAYTDEQMAEEFLQADYVDPKKWENQVYGTLLFSETESGNYAMTSLSRFLADISSEKLDVCGMQEADFLKYDDSGSFLDLTICLSEEEIRRFEGQFLITEDGRRIGIRSEALPRLKEWGCYTGNGNQGVVGIIYNTTHLEEAKQYLTGFLAKAGS
ncbi:MAG: hypothetical protein Q4B22_09970 [Eubacteriales bacterium]|nr:hypothetical protein [Eubacteriales bacterium]